MYISVERITKKTVAQAESLSATVFAYCRGVSVKSEFVYGGLRLVHSFGGCHLVDIFLVERRQDFFYFLQHRLVAFAAGFLLQQAHFLILLYALCHTLKPYGAAAVGIDKERVAGRPCGEAGVGERTHRPTVECPAQVSVESFLCAVPCQPLRLSRRTLYEGVGARRCAACVERGVHACGTSAGDALGREVLVYYHAVIVELVLQLLVI